MRKSVLMWIVSLVIAGLSIPVTAQEPEAPPAEATPAEAAPTEPAPAEAAPAETAPAEAAPAEAASAEPEKQGPKIECDQPSFNFGERDPADSVEHTYVLRNGGDMPLEIKNVRTSCGCTVANITSKNVAPGETTEVTAKLNLKNRRGKQRKSITVESNDPSKPRFPLYLEGMAISLLDVQPSRVFFGQIEEDASLSETVTLTARGDATFNITGVETSLDHIETALETVQDGKEYKLTISTKGTLDRGAFRGNVRVKTDSEKTPVIDISVSGTVLDELTVAPTQIVLAQKPDAVTRYIVVRPGRTKVFHVQEVTPPDPDIHVDIRELPQNQGYQIRLDNLIAKPELDGTQLTIKTDVESKAEILIPFKVIPTSS